MPDAPYVQIAQAITDALKAGVAAGSFAMEFRPSWSYFDFGMKLEVANKLRVDVIPAGFAETEANARFNLEDIIQTDIGVRKRFDIDQHNADGTLDRSAINDLGKLVTEIRAFFVSMANTSDNGVLEGYAAAQWVDSEVRALYVPEHLRELKQFTGIVRVQHSVNEVTG